MTSSILFQTTFPLRAPLPAEARATVACRRAQGCSSWAAPWCAPAPPHQGDNGGRSFALGQVWQQKHVVAHLVPEQDPAAVYRTLHCGSPDSGFFKALLPSTSTEVRNARSPGNHLSLLIESISAFGISHLSIPHFFH